MKVNNPKLRAFDFYAQEVGYEYALVNSLHRSPQLKDFLADLDPEMSLNWSKKSFYGLPELRERIISTQDYKVPVENVFVTSGTNEANFLIMMQTVNPGDEVITDLPGWPQPFSICEALGASVHGIRRIPEENWRLDLDALEGMVNNKTRLIFLSSPNNPTGAVFSEEEMKRICEIAQACDAYLVCDEIYRGLEWDDKISPAAVNYYEKAVSTGGVSKSTGLQGIRIGWMASQDKALLEDCNILRIQTTQVANVFGEYVALAALETTRYKQLVDGAKAQGREGWGVVSNWIDEQEAFSWVKPKAGFLSFPKFDLPIDSDEFCKRLLAEPYKTYLRPGSAYGFGQHLRLGIGQYETSEIHQALERISTFIKDLQV
ncbi:MAG: aspartate/methionine/tyrosine aminotransferase [Gammaproteobacteria bacterium]|jgi:aspartate/methionine/tyrosine aminotransferase